MNCTNENFTSTISPNITDVDSMNHTGLTFQDVITNQTYFYKYFYFYL